MNECARNWAAELIAMLIAVERGNEPAENIVAARALANPVPDSPPRLEYVPMWDIPIAIANTVLIAGPATADVAVGRVITGVFGDYSEAQWRYRISDVMALKFHPGWRTPTLVCPLCAKRPFSIEIFSGAPHAANNGGLQVFSTRAPDSMGRGEQEVVTVHLYPSGLESTTEITGWICSAIREHILTPRHRIEKFKAMVFLDGCLRLTKTQWSQVLERADLAGMGRVKDAHQWQWHGQKAWEWALLEGRPPVIVESDEEWDSVWVDRRFEKDASEPGMVPAQTDDEDEDTRVIPKAMTHERATFDDERRTPAAMAMLEMERKSAPRVIETGARPSASLPFSQNRLPQTYVNRRDPPGNRKERRRKR